MYNNFPIIIIKPDNNNCNKFNFMIYESIIKLKDLINYYKKYVIII